MPRGDLMHPRNIFRVPPDYTKLAVKYDYFRRICKLGLNGKVSVDLKKEDALYQLTKLLLEEYFGLNLILPGRCLVPTVPLRLNYILWLEDIMNTFHLTDINGIDIGRKARKFKINHLFSENPLTGCGASGIYCLLAAKKNGWQMIGLELSEDNVSFCNKNIETNNLGHLITIYDQKDKNVIFDNVLAVNDESKTFDFCLCNPPFFDKGKASTNCNRTDHRKEPKNAPTGTDEELSCEGGEVAFIEKIIDESLIYKSRIRFYTTMIGVKANVQEVTNLLMSRELTNYACTEFCQGNVTRWGLVWSHDETLDLDKVSCIVRNRKI